VSEYDEETIGDAVDQAMHDADKAISDFADRGIAFAINVKNYHRPQKQLATFPAEFLKNYTGSASGSNGFDHRTKRRRIACK